VIGPITLKWIMGKLADTVRTLIEEGRYLISEHASDRIAERGFIEWQVVDGSTQGKALRERPRNRPHPAVEFQCLLPDGSEFKAVWCLLRQSRIAKLVTVHYRDEE
jgi:hypothetical protein